MQISVLKNGRELSPWAGLCGQGKPSGGFSMNVRYTVLQPTVVEGCLGSGKVGECWNQFKVGSDIHLHRRHLLSLFRTYLVTSRQKTCQELPGVKSMKKEEYIFLWEHGASRQHVRFMMFYMVYTMVYIYIYIFFLCCRI